MNQIIASFQNQLSSLVNRFRRTARKKPVKKEKSFQPEKYGRSFGQVFTRIRKTIFSRAGFLVYAALLALIVLFTFVKFFSFHPTVSALDWNPKQSELVDGEVNVLLMSYENQDKYAFIDFLAVVSISRSDQKHKLMVVNPDFATTTLKKQIKLRNILSNSAAEDVSPMASLLSGVEGLLGLKIDRYLVIESAKIPALFDGLGVKVKAYDQVSDKDAGEFKKDEELRGERLAAYLAAEGTKAKASQGGLASLSPEELRSRRQAQFVGEMVSSYLGWGNLPRLIAVSEAISKAVETNMSREEFLMVGLLISNNPRLETAYLKTLDSTFVKDGNGGALYEPNLSVIDRQVQELFARIDVRKEQARIEIYNGTRTRGIAAMHKRLVENLGGNVVRASNSPEQTERTILYVEDLEKYKYNVDLLKQILASQVIIVEEDYPQQHAAEIVLVIGEDTIQRISQ